jgi:uncharacterized membrane protein
MQTLKQYYNQVYTSRFIQVLIYNVVTITAVVVGIFQFIARSWNENELGQKLKAVINKILRFIPIVTSKLYTLLNQDQL